MLLEVQKCDPDLQLLDELMTATFSQRRKEIIAALFNERQVTSANPDIHSKLNFKEVMYLLKWIVVTWLI